MVLALVTAFVVAEAVQPNGQGSSVAENSTGFMDTVRHIVESKDAYRTFKRNKNFTQILEHIDEDLAGLFLNVTAHMSPHLLEDGPIFDAVRECSVAGGPVVHTFHVGTHATPEQLAPSMMRYVKQLSDIEWFFGPGPFERVVEIGGGYGGLAALVAIQFRVKGYTIYDLPEVQALCRLHLSDITLPAGVHFYFPPFPNATRWRRMQRTRRPWRPKYDLCISSYALSELNQKMMRSYMMQVLLYCRRGVIHWNDFTVGLGRFLPELMDLLALPIRALPDIPTTGPSNTLLLWGENDESVARWTREIMHMPLPSEDTTRNQMRLDEGYR